MTTFSFMTHFADNNDDEFINVAFCVHEVMLQYPDAGHERKSCELKVLTEIK